MTTPPRPEVVVGSVVVHDGRILLVRRAQEPEAGRWSVPGGRLEPGETVHEAAVREVAEEAGIGVVVDRFLGWVERVHPGFHFVILDFLTVPEDPDPVLRPGSDADRAKWVDLDDLDNYHLVDGLIEFLEDVGIIGTTRTLEI